MSLNLTEKRCQPLPSDTAPLRGGDLTPYREALSDQWTVEDEHHLVGSFRFRNFIEALAFTNRVGALSEAEGHHPEITLGWGEATVRIWTHSIDGLSENDFILAAKVDAVEG